MKQNNFFIMLLVAGFTSIMTAQVPSYVPTNGLVGYWPFNGNANDVSTNANNGTNNGATLTTDRFGNVNSAYSFNGISNYIQLPNNAQITPPNITVCFWFKMLSNNTNQRLLRQRSNGFDVGYNMQIQHGASATNKLNSTLYTNSTNFYEPIFNTNVNNQQWHQFAFSYDGLNYKIFIDSILVYQNNANGAGALYYNNSGNGFTIGRDGDNPDWYLNGVFDDMGIWNRALTQDEITNLYNANICYQSVTVTDTLVINVGILGYNPVTYTNSITIYPNPAKDHITIDCGTLSSVTGYQIKISNLLGQEVFSTTLNQQQYSIPLSSWTGRGIYLVKVYDANNNLLTTRKIDLQ